MSDKNHISLLYANKKKMLCIKTYDINENTTILLKDNKY